MKPYNVNFSKRARSEFLEFSRSTSSILLSWITEYLEGSKNPRVRVRSLTGESNRWRYQIEKYRVLAELEDKTITILTVYKGIID